MSAVNPTPASFPLRPRKAARLLLRKRLRDVGLTTYFRALRLAYRIASFDDDELGPLIDDLAIRYPVTSPGAKSPAIDVSFIEVVIRLEVGLPENASVTPSVVDDWLKLRARRVRTGQTSQELSAREEAILFPEWGLEAVGAFVEIGPAASRARVESFGTYFAGGRDDFTSTKSLIEQSRHVPAPSSVRGLRESIVGLLDLGTTQLKKDFEENMPAILARWPGDWKNLRIRPDKWSRPRHRARLRAEVVRPAFKAVDEICAAPFMARFGLTDIEVAANDAVFWDSFKSREHARQWLINTNIAQQVRNRALTLVVLVAGERAPEMVEAMIRHVTLPPFEHSGMQQKWGVLRPVGALLVGRSDKTDGDTGAHDQPLPIEVCDRLRVLLLLYKAARDVMPDDAPLFQKDVFTDSAPKGLRRRAMATAAASILAKAGAYPVWADARSYNPLRRYTDTVIADLFEEFRAGHEGIPSRIDAFTVKEITLGHEDVPLDPHTYAGLSDDEGRFVASSYGAEIVVQTIYGDLGVKLGPDVDRIRSELTTQRGIEQTLTRVESEWAAAKERMVDLRRSAPLADAQSGAALLEYAVQRDMLADERDDLRDQADALLRAVQGRENRVADLFNDQDLWVPLADDARRLSRADLRVLCEEILRPQADSDPLVRDFITLVELARCFGVDPTTVAGWVRHPKPETMSRICPWVGQAPITKPNQRTLLIAAAAIDLDRIRDADAKAAFRDCLTIWPTERGWDPQGGQKTRTVRALATSPVRLNRPPANDLFIDPPESCVRIFALDGSPG